MQINGGQLGHSEQEVDQKQDVMIPMTYAAAKTCENGMCNETAKSQTQNQTTSGRPKRYAQ
ncbi:hypothetical protein T11_10559 [Trichinella zimbabwensis]|uniref:Uncharacterized protein n=2 Tax=Trichinella TaxID=6333 RepID=A0A0V1N280_9BILA|nr:hypothetical protein T11_10559 [Trichinella zimbabwensis]KRZ77936.1 hypothetical protein T10_5755 [Trichinella papuae]